MTTTPWVALRDEAVPEAVERLLLTVPEWFGRPESNLDYVDAARSKETWTVRDAQGEVVGILLVDRHFPHVAEVHLMVVERTLQGLGVGRALLSALEQD